MKLAVLAFACFVTTFVAAETEQEFEIDWHHITPINIRVEPIGPANIYPGIRIAGGSVAAPNAFPYQAALIIDDSDFCSGSIISNQFVLTAAHCVDNATHVQVIVGAQNLTEPTRVILNASALVIHNGWNPNTLHNDIALVKVANIPIGKVGISAIALAPASSGTFVGSTAVLSGWGLTSEKSTSLSPELMTVQLPVITQDVCQRSFDNSINAQQICTSGEGGRDACSGDSGGPLVVNDVEIGLVSYGGDVCQGGYPTVYTRVSSFRKWIRKNSGV